MRHLNLKRSHYILFFGFFLVISILSFPKEVSAQQCQYFCTYNQSGTQGCYPDDRTQSGPGLQVSCLQPPASCSLCPAPGGGGGEPYGYEYQFQYDYQYEYEYQFEPDFVITELSARNAAGNQPSYFDAGDPIYVRTQLENIGDAGSCCATRIALYKDKENAVATGTISDVPNMYIDEPAGVPAGGARLYESYSGGNRRDQFTTFSFNHDEAGTYYLRAFADYNNTVNEYNAGSQNQARDTYQVRAAIYGYACHSLNEDSTCDTGEPKVEGIRMYLERDADSNGSYETDVANELTVDASDDHDYEFEHLQAGNYEITMSSNSWLAESSNPRTTTLGGNTRIRFAVIPSYDISGYVCIDNDRDGTRDSDETTGYEGATVTLSGPDDGTTTTAAGTGQFTFSNVRRGNYTLTLTVPSGYKAYPNADNTRTISIPLNSTQNSWRQDICINRVYNINGRVYVDQDDSNSYLAGTDTPLNNKTVTLGGDKTGTDATDSNGQFTFSALEPGTYTVTTALTNTWRPVTSLPRSVTITDSDQGANIVFGTYTISGTVFIDTNRDGIHDAGETTPYANATIALSGPETATTTSDASGNYSFPSLQGGTYTVTVTEPNNYKAYPSTAGQVVIPSNSTQQVWDHDIGLNTAYTVTGRVYIDVDKNGSYNAATDMVHANRTVTLSGGSSDRTDSTDSSGVYTIQKVEPGSYTINASLPGDYISLIILPASITVVNGTVTQHIPTFGRYTITGNVFVDDNNSDHKDGNEQNYQADPNIAVSAPNGAPTPIVINNNDGTYRVEGLISQTYNVQYPASSLPQGYLMNHPVNGPPASFNATVGDSCSPASPTPGGTCNAGNLENLDFAIKGGQPWWQGYGFDIRFDDGINNQIPPSPNAACGGPYALLPASSATPGIAFTGDTPADFWNGRASADPYNWIAGGASYPELFSPTNGSVKTSYDYMQAVLTQSSITPLNLASSCTLSNCTLPANLANGVYQANGNVVLNSFTAAANRDIVILVNGNLTINGNLRVPTTSTVFYSVSGDIIVSPSVGETTISCPAPTTGNGNLEGFFSTDQNFIAQGNASCEGASPVKDRQLHIQGSVVVGADDGTGGFTNDRDLCMAEPFNNLNYPSVTLRERPDMVLNSPEILRVPSYVWQEVAP